MTNEPEAIYTFLGDNDTFLSEGPEQQALLVVDYGKKGGLIAFKVMDLYNVAKSAINIDLLASPVPQDVIDSLLEDSEYDEDYSEEDEE